MKKVLNIFFTSVFLFTLVSFTAFRDMGSKPRVDIKLENKPGCRYYMDLLYYTEEPAFPAEYEKFDMAIYKLLFCKREENWMPAVAEGKLIMSGQLEPDENGKHRFGYLGVPDEFKIIIVTENGQVKISDVIHRKTMEAHITLDYITMEYTTKPMWQVYPAQFAVTCGITLVVELTILILFGFKLKENLTVFMATNIATQLLLTAVFSRTFLYNGTLACYVFLIPVEILITFIESKIYRRKLKGHSKDRCIGYAVTANLISAGLTFVNLQEIMDFMFRLIR